MENKSFLLIPAVQTYAWGKVGHSSAVAQLAVQSIPDFNISKDEPYAELWMGTHSKAPSRIAETGSTLSQWLQDNPSCVGGKVTEAFGQPGQLPFLLKVLSVNKSLSIQAHPNKKHAELLHKSKPDKYPDPNHKPEMAIAITEFEGLCGFRPKREILQNFKAIDELRGIVGESLVAEFEKSTNEEETQSTLRRCFTALMTCPQEKIESSLNSLLGRLQAKVDKGEDISGCQGDLFRRLHSQYPGDIGCFVIYFLNYMVLQPGESIFLEANLPHAYLDGDIIECQACSDNVVRAGLTPKFKDVSTLCEMLSYSCRSAEESKFMPETREGDPYLKVFNPPVLDFTVARIELPSSTAGYRLDKLESASILLVVKGAASISSQSDPTREALQLAKGSVLFISANESLCINAIPSDSDLLVFRAYVQF